MARPFCVADGPQSGQGGGMAGFDDITRKAKAFLEEEKVQQALKSEQAEKVSDTLLDGVANAAKKVTGGKHDTKIDEARTKADGAVGDR
jgi:hypothetical protein